MLSKYEMDLVCDTEVILTKNRIMKIVSEKFAALSEQFTNEASGRIDQELLAIPPKISKGENYSGLPYIILDYPRNFNREDTFAIRTFFWWGNFFSITLQLSGSYQQKYLPTINKAIKENLLQHWYYCVSDYQWHHHFESDNYNEVTSNVSLGEELPFLKIARKISLNDWEESMPLLLENFKTLLLLLEH